MEVKNVEEVMKASLDRKSKKIDTEESEEIADRETL